MTRIGLLVGVALGITAIGLTIARPTLGDERTEIGIRYSHFTPAEVTASAGVPITVVLRNDDPIDHEWIVGDAAIHERHRTGTEPVHTDRPTEVSVPAGTTVVTTVTFQHPGAYQFICHLPAHEAYGMVGTLVVRPS